MDRENRGGNEGESTYKEKREEGPGKREEAEKARERGTGDPIHTLGLADITCHALGGDPGGRGRCCNLDFPADFSSAQSAAPGKNNTWPLEERLAKLLAAPGLAASPLRARAHGMLLHFGQVVCRQQQPHMQGLPRSSHGGALHPGHCTAPGCSAAPCAAARSRMQRSAVRCKALRALGNGLAAASCQSALCRSLQHCLLHQPKMLLLPR
jgi:hypothetical protein